MKTTAENTMMTGFIACALVTEGAGTQPVALSISGNIPHIIPHEIFWGKTEGLCRVKGNQHNLGQ